MASDQPIKQAENEQSSSVLDTSCEIPTEDKALPSKSTATVKNNNGKSLQSLNSVMDTSPIPEYQGILYPSIESKAEGRFATAAEQQDNVESQHPNDDSVESRSPDDESVESQSPDDESVESRSPDENDPSVGTGAHLLSFQHEKVHFLEDNENDLRSFTCNFPLQIKVEKSNMNMDDGAKITLENDIKFIVKEVEHSYLNKDNVHVHETGENYVINQSSFDVLPKEILLKIFAFFTPHELCRWVIPVCKRWYEAGHDPVLWRELDLSSFCDIPSTDLCRTISKASLLKKLSLLGRNDNLSAAEIAVFTQYIPHLESVNLAFCNNVGKTVLEYFVRNCRHLQSLNVEGCHTVNDNAVEALLQAQNLQHFNFSHCNLSDLSVVLLAKHMTSIVSFNVDGISWITDSAVMFLVENHRKNLVELDLDGAELTDKSIQHIATCSKLKRLQISFCEGLTDKALRYVQTLSSMRCLKLRKGLYFTSDELLFLFMCESMSGLTQLDMSECTQFIDNCVIQMAECCGKSLTNLALSWCWNITDTGIVSVVDKCRNLQILDIVGLDKITGKYFQRIPKDMPRLQLLNLQQCNRIIDDLIEDVVRMKPDLSVYNYYGEQFVHS